MPIEGQAAQDDRVDHGEDGRARADAEREDEQRDRGEGGRLPERPDRIRDIVMQRETYGWALRSVFGHQAGQDLADGAGRGDRERQAALGRRAIEIAADRVDELAVETHAEARRIQGISSAWYEGLLPNVGPIVLHRD